MGDRPNVIFVLGGPGTGKGTQCARLREKFGYHHLSAGDLLREERSREGSEHGELIMSYINEGKVVPSQITVKLLEKAMRNLGWEGGNFLVDGFPRSFENLSAWEEVVGGKVNVKSCLFFDCSEEVMEARLLERGKTSGRSDDNIEAIKKRFRTFQEETIPVADKFMQDGILKRLNTEQSIEEVWDKIHNLFKPQVVFVLGGPGAGKGTQCAKLVETFGYHHLSAGDLLREEKTREGSEHGELINTYIREGKVVPSEITVKLLEKAMKGLEWEGGNFLVDGFPRSFENLSAWEKVLGDTVNVRLCLFFDCSEEEMEIRLLERGKTSGRSDDNIESIRKRFHTFKDESMPVVDKFEGEGILRKVNSQRSVEEVWDEVSALLKP
ncbi:unnamed protein product [Polarella glacialis]|uniref:UMP-CMP kinase n=1 Tax=Polarella glacialis TaxID=89957 RepID=A0A813JEI2_POLGL|nr:unnamed protein product [Polarella glacialis]